MADRTKIEWTRAPNGTPGATWNPITGCSVVSPGCTNCYAMRLAGVRMQHHWSRQGLTQPSKAGPVWTGEVRFNEPWLDQPLRWRRPRRIFVCAHGDLFAEGVPDEWIDRVFAVMALAPQHTFLVLTKRAQRMREYLTAKSHAWDAGHACGRVAILCEQMRKQRGEWNGIGPVGHLEPGASWWPLANVWLGVSVEDQARADERIPALLATPAAKRFISAEPLLGPIDLTRLPMPGDLYDALRGEGQDPGSAGKRLDWVIVGGESGPGARPMHPDWARSLRDQCVAAGVPFFFTKWGEWIGADEKLDRMRAGGIRINAECAPSGLIQPLSFADAAWMAEATGYAGRYEHQSDGTTLIRVGKKAAGRLLDGREWNEVPG